MRILRTPDEFIDILSAMHGRKYVTFGYICSANLNIPQGKRQNPATGRMVNCNDMKAFGQQLGVEQDIAGIIKLSKYNLRFMNREEFSRAYGLFNQRFDTLKAKYDYPESTRKTNANNGKYSETMGYGKGVDVYNGNRDELQGHTYIKQDTNKARIKSTYYLIDTNGFIIRSYTKQELTNFLKNIDYLEPGVAAMRKLGREETRIQEYIAEFSKIKMLPKSFEYNQILYMVGTAEGEKFLYINSNLTRTIKDVECEIVQEQFVKIAEDQYRDSFVELQQYANENGENTDSLTEALQVFKDYYGKNKQSNIMDKKKLYESIMKNVAKEVKKALNEDNNIYIDKQGNYRDAVNTLLQNNDTLNQFVKKYVGQYDIQENETCPNTAFDPQSNIIYVNPNCDEHTLVAGIINNLVELALTHNFDFFVDCIENKDDHREKIKNNCLLSLCANSIIAIIAPEILRYLRETSAIFDIETALGVR